MCHYILHSNFERISEIKDLKIMEILCTSSSQLFRTFYTSLRSSINCSSRPGRIQKLDSASDNKGWVHEVSEKNLKFFASGN